MRNNESRRPSPQVYQRRPPRIRGPRSSLNVASLRKEVHANHKPSPAPVDPRQRAPPSPPGPAPELFEDTRLRISMEHCYYPLRAGTAATPSLMTSSARPSGPDRPFRLLRDSDRPLRHRPPRSCSPQRSPDPPGHSIAAASSGSAHPPDYSDRLDTLNRGTTHPPTTTGFFAAPRLHLIRPGSTLDGLPRSPPEISGAPGC